MGPGRGTEGGSQDTTWQVDRRRRVLGNGEASGKPRPGTDGSG